MKITDLRSVPLRLEREVGALEPAWDPGGAMAFQRGGGAILEVHTDSGFVGIGPGVKKRVLEIARPVLLGADPRDVEALFERVRYGMRGRAGMAGVDIALWDLCGKIAGRSLAELWGGGRGRVPVYASMVQLSTPDERARLAAELRQQGFRAIKLRLHHETLRSDVETVAAVRAAVGDDVALLTDANQAQSIGDWQPGVRWDPQRALDTARELERLGCAWLEEPLPRYAFAELARLCRAVELPIAGGENNLLQDFDAVLQGGVYDIVQPDAMVLDGLTGLRRVAAAAAARGVRCSPHHGGRGLGTIAHLHLLGAAGGDERLELLHDPPIGDYRHGFAFLREPPVVGADGCIPVPTGPGLGVEVDPDFLQPGP